MSLSIYNLVMFYYNKWRNPILWTRASEALYRVLTTLTDKRTAILEVGSGTGHISYLLARRGNPMSLNDIRTECLTESARHFKAHGLTFKTITGSLYGIKKQYPFIWNSGLIQCLRGRERERFVTHLAQIGSRVCLFYPDTDSIAKVKGKNAKKLPGVDDAVEYSVIDVPALMNKHFAKVTLGELSAQEIDLPYRMYWICGENDL
jgi:hypothetical protein